MPPRATLPRKLPRQERSKATVDAILAATARVLVRDGYERTSTNRIAAQAGVSVGSLYQYFPSKEALVLALVDRHVTATRAALLAKMGAVLEAPLEAAVSEVVSAMVELYGRDPQLRRVLVEQLPRVGRLRELLEEIEANAMRLVRTYLERHTDELRVTDLDTASFLVVSAVQAATHAAVVTRPERLRDGRLVAGLVDMVLRYLAKDRRG